MCKYCKEKGITIANKFIGKFGDAASLGLTIDLDRDTEAGEAGIGVDLSLYNGITETPIIGLYVPIRFCPFCGEQIAEEVKV